MLIHTLKNGERLVFEDDNRIFTPVTCAEPDTLLDVINIIEVVLPMVVDSIEQE